MSKTAAKTHSGHHHPTWREGYPYEHKLARDEYEATKLQLQIELLKLQNWVKESGQKIIMIFEGRDARG